MRTIHFSCDPSAIAKLSDDQHDALLRAIGRQVIYAEGYGADNPNYEARLFVIVRPDGVELPMTIRHTETGHTFTVVGISDSTALKYSYHS